MIILILLVFICACIILFTFTKKSTSSSTSNKELFQNNDKFEYYDHPKNIYDTFYASIYDSLVHNNIRTDFEIGVIVPLLSNYSHKIRIIDIGCGTGHFLGKLSKQIKSSMYCLGIDQSSSMIEKAKKNYENENIHWKIGNANDFYLISINYANIITCLYFTIYYIQNKQHFFSNCYQWIKPGGYFIIHLVNRHTFDPILPPGNPLYIVSPQKYAKKRITQTKINFYDFHYISNFEMTSNDNAKFIETFRFSNGKRRKHEHYLYMEDKDIISQQIINEGFIVHQIINMISCAYEEQYLYIYKKPSNH